MPFDVEGAKKAGYSDAEIADHLAKISSFDAAGARKAGYTDDQIIGHLSMTGEKPAQQAKPQGFGAQLQSAIEEVPRQLGLTARHSIEGVTGAMGFAVDPFLNMAGLPTVAGGGRQVSDMIGLPTPQNTTERVVGDASRMLAGSAGIVGAAGQGAKLASGAAGGMLKSMADKPAAQLSGAVGAGGASGYTRETGGDDGAQLLAAVGGSVLGGGLPSIGSGIGRGIKAAGATMTGKAHAVPPNLDIRIAQIVDPQLQQAGLRWGDLPQHVKASIRSDAAQALKLGGGLDDDAIRRLADYRLTGLTPTRGTVTQNPTFITQEKNIAKASANMADGGLPAVQNANMLRLTSGLDDVGANKSLDRLSVGDRVVSAIKSKDARAQAHENKLYAAARDTEGRSAPLDRSAFANRVDELLAQDGKHAFLPAEFRTRINEIALGQVKVGGKTFDTPFNVDTINSLKTELAAAGRGAKDGNVRRAISLVRQALDETPITGDVPAASMKAFDKARAFARARRNWQESAPAIKDALDDIPPDRFVEQYIIGQTSKASAAAVEKLAFEVQKAGVKKDVKAYIAAYLKKQATGDAVGSSTADASRFSAAAYGRALDQIGDAKLRLFFQPGEVAQLKAIGRAAKYETAQPTGSAVNNSNTAGAAFAQALDAIGNSKILSRLPFGDAAIRQPAQNWAVQIKADGAKNITPTLAGLRPRPKNNLLAPSVVPLLVAPGAMQDR